MYKVWCGKDAAFMQYNLFSAVFLRVADDNIISVLRHAEVGIVGIASGHGIRFDAHADYCFLDPDTGIKHFNTDEMCAAFEAHDNDTVSTDDSGLVYTAYNGREYRLQLAEEGNTDEVSPTDEQLRGMSLADKMRVWNCYIRGNTSTPEHYFIAAEMNTEKYSVTFNIDPDNYIYCRFGAHGYCDKGYAMLSTVCIRHNECRMIPDNTEALKGFTPDDKYFKENSCAFPPDGSWYWSVQRVEDNVVYLNGCRGDTYEIYRR